MKKEEPKLIGMDAKYDVVPKQPWYLNVQLLNTIQKLLSTPLYTRKTIIYDNEEERRKMKKKEIIELGKGDYKIMKEK